MPREKQRVEKAKKIVEVSTELVEGEALPVVSEPTSTVAAETAQPESHKGKVETPEQCQSAQKLEPVPEIETPAVFLENSALPFAKFVLIPLLCLFLSDLLMPMVTGWILQNSYVRTAVLCAFIWNLIGAVLYARAREGRHIIIWYFAVPLATVWLWAPLLLTLVSVLSYWLPPNLK